MASLKLYEFLDPVSQWNMVILLEEQFVGYTRDVQ
jgi:hypothetical protein